jgi:uncharacterized protein YbjQ (UPF0145 family)
MLTERLRARVGGIVSEMGSTFSSDVAVLKKLRKAAADLGADAVIVTGQYRLCWFRISQRDFADKTNFLK